MPEPKGQKKVVNRLRFIASTRSIGCLNREEKEGKFKLDLCWNMKREKWAFEVENSRGSNLYKSILSLLYAKYILGKTSSGGSKFNKTFLIVPTTHIKDVSKSLKLIGRIIKNVAHIDSSVPLGKAIRTRTYTDVFTDYKAAKRWVEGKIGKPKKWRIS